MATGLRAAEKQRKRSRLGRLRRRETMWGILFVAPAVLGFLLWQLGPIIGSLFIAFTDWRLAGTPQWIGTGNFEKIFAEDRLFRKSLGVTVYYSLGSVPLRMLVAFALAVLLNQKIRALPVFRTIFYLPSIVPVIASSMLWLWLFNPDFGLLNSILRPLGFPKLQWIYASDSVIPALILMSLWDIGPMMIIFLAALQGVPRQLYEAVEIDGGNAWHRMRHITVPIVTPAILFNLILSIIVAMQTFTQAYVMTDGGPNNNSLLYVLYLYRKAFEQSQMGYASALAWVLFIIIAGLSLFVFRSSSRWVYYGGR
ncbi:MAG: sugar ABC transporter permease [Truepera sp.]|nr:sugar ABC transporter permease [Truepera sp.]